MLIPNQKLNISSFFICGDAERLGKLRMSPAMCMGGLGIRPSLRSNANPLSILLGKRQKTWKQARMILMVWKGKKTEWTKVGFCAFPHDENAQWETRRKKFAQTSKSLWKPGQVHHCFDFLG